ncbi:hypothetical protein Cgig2_026203 [Carnegiea gigantea]|uniref:Uncharacterized protein n=1 Tax=Carnegiea gigantea TaxID=171969 RepID=A0A9Q1GRQ1_9CARY|nr:hypothetical protein Cgig2_026203 [Carnegiea gigantea]
MEVIINIVTEVDEKELNVGYRNAQSHGLSQIILTKKLKPVIGPTMRFGLDDRHSSQALIMILWLVDIITLTCLKKLQCAGKDLEQIINYTYRYGQQCHIGSTNSQRYQGDSSVIPPIHEIRATNAIWGSEDVRRTEFNKRSLLTKEAWEESYNRCTSSAFHYVKERSMNKDDLIIRKMKATGKGAVQGKLTPNWEGPYMTH